MQFFDLNIFSFGNLRAVRMGLERSLKCDLRRIRNPNLV